MGRTFLIVAIVGTILAAPIFCIAGIAEHDCVCALVDCCDEETFCDLDPCDSIFKTEGWRTQPISVMASALPNTEVRILAPGKTHISPPRHCPLRSLPFPDSDLPLRI